MIKPLSLIARCLIALALLAGPALAQMPAPDAKPLPAPGVGPDPAANPVLATIIKSGAKLYYLGSREGLDGWFIVKDGEVQMAYATPKSHQALLGALFGPGGENITSNQVQALLASNKELATALSTQANNAINGASPAKTGMPMVPIPNAPAAEPAPAANLATPGERMLHDFQNAPSVMLGSPTAPLLVMVMDPDCPHCKAVWRSLRDQVANNSLQIRMIPIDTTLGDHERAAAQFLHVADPATTLTKYMEGDKSQLAGTPDPILIGAVQANRALTDSWHIKATPFLVYRGKDGKVKIVQGEPDSLSAVLSDIAP